MSISGIIAFTVLVIFVNCMVLLLGKESFHDCFNIDVTSGLLFSEDDAGAINERQVLINRELLSKCDTEKSNVLAEKKSLPTDTPSSGKSDPPSQPANPNSQAQVNLTSQPPSSDNTYNDFI